MQSILGTLLLYEKQVGGQDARQLQSAIRHFLLTGWGFPLPSKRSTQQDMKNAEYVLAQLPVEKLYDWETAIEEGFELVGKIDKQRSAPRTHVRKFVTWCIESGILVDPTNHERVVKTAPAVRRDLGHRPRTRRKPAELSRYRLREEEINPSLRAEMEEFLKFLTAYYYKKRRKKKVRLSTGEMHLKTLRKIFGWLHQERGVQLQDLCFALISCPVDLKDENAADAAADLFRELLTNFAIFLLERGNHPSSVVRVLTHLSRFIQFQYLGRYADKHGNDIPVMQVLRELIEFYESCAEDELDPLLIEMKWVDLPDVIQKITLRTFEFTEFRTHQKAKRPTTAIANSFQESIMWGSMTLNPPRRPGEWRNCKVALACELNERPANLEADAWIWPLPPSRRSKEEISYSYLTRQYVYVDPVTQEKFGSYLGTIPPSDRQLERIPLWFKDTPKQAAKSGDSHKYQKVLVMDRRVYRDKNFYDFIEAYLMGYWRDRYGNWISVGNSMECPGLGFQFYELRSTLAEKGLDTAPEEELEEEEAELLLDLEADEDDREEEESFDKVEQGLFLDLDDEEDEETLLELETEEKQARNLLQEEPLSSNRKVPSCPWGWLFVGIRIGKPFREGDFGGKFARVAYRLTGQFLTPHLIRSIYAVYILETIGDRATLLSLAHCMGHKLETLEKIYDKRRPHEKTRLIEVAVTQHLDRICAGQPMKLKMPEEGGVKLSFDTLKEAIEQLSPKERKMLLQCFT
jgi:hypothetical protein